MPHAPCTILYTATPYLVSGTLKIYRLLCFFPLQEYCILLWFPKLRLHRWRFLFVRHIMSECLQETTQIQLRTAFIRFSAIRWILLYPSITAQGSRQIWSVDSWVRWPVAQSHVTVGGEKRVNNKNNQPQTHTDICLREKYRLCISVILMCKFFKFY